MTGDGKLPRMIFSTRAPLIIRTAFTLVCLLCACAVMTATALAASAVHFESENLSALKVQLRNHEVHALAFHPATGTGHIHASLNDGRHMTVLYATGEQAQLVALARADGTPVAIAAAKPKAASKPVHHKLRYIAGGILVVVIVVVAVVLLVDRRRKLGEGGHGEAGEGHVGGGEAGGSAPAPSPGEPT